MIIDVVMPKLGESLTEGTIIKWWKSPGDSIQEDEILLEVSTDKVDSEIPSAYSGILVEILVEENETVAVQSVIARLEVQDAISPSAESIDVSRNASSPLPQEVTEASPDAIARFPAQELPGKFYSPAVLRIAREQNVSLQALEAIKGSGKQGRVTKKDLTTYLQSKETTSSPLSAPISSPPSPPSPPPEREEQVEVITVDSLHQAMARAMRHSVDTAAHAYCVSECDVTHITRLIHTHEARFYEEEKFKLTFMPFMLSAVIQSLHEYPRMNSAFQGEQFLQKSVFHLGMAVATDRGLLVPVIKHADEKNFRGLARSIHELAIHARENRITLEELEGATFTVSNYGVFGNILGIPIINPPNVGILGVGAIHKSPMVIESDEGDSIAIRSKVYLTLGFDHRLIDGAVGGGFLQRVVDHLTSIDWKI